MFYEVSQSNAFDIYSTTQPKNGNTVVAISVSYPSKTKKTIVLLSTMHNMEEINTEVKRRTYYFQLFTGLYANLTQCFLHPEIQDGGQIPEVVIIWRRKTIST